MKVEIFQKAKKQLTAEAYDKAILVARITDADIATDVRVVENHSQKHTYRTFEVRQFTHAYPTIDLFRTTTTNYHKAIGIAISANT